MSYGKGDQLHGIQSDLRSARRNNIVKAAAFLMGAAAIGVFIGMLLMRVLG